MKEKIRIFVCENYLNEIKQVIRNLDGFNCSIVPLKQQCVTRQLREKVSELDVSKADYNLYIASSCNYPIVENDYIPDNLKIIKEEQCFDFILNRESVKYYNADGAYLLSSGWLSNWSDNIKEWGFDRISAQEFFKESCRYLMLLDTGVMKSSEKDLKEMASFLKVDYKILPVGLDLLQYKITTQLQEFELKNQQKILQKNYNDNQKQLAEFVMTLDLVNVLSQSNDELKMIKDMINLFEMLFAPKETYFLNISVKDNYTLFDNNLKHITSKKIRNDLLSLSNGYEICKDNSSFKFSINFGEIHLATVLIKNVAHPEYINRYLNLIVHIQKILGLTISNTRRYKKIEQQSKDLFEKIHELKINERRYLKAQETGKVGDWEFYLKSQKFWGSYEAKRMFNLDQNIEELSFEYVENRIIQREKIHQAVIDLIEKDKPYDVIYQLYPYEDVGVRTIQSRAVLERDDTGKPISVVGVVQDISKQVENENKIKQKDEQIEIIERILWHDISNSFAALKSCFRLFKKTESNEILDYGDGLVEKGINLIKKMRTVQKTLKDSGELQIVNVSKLLESTIKNYTIKINIKGDCIVMADEALTPVFDNIISNAIRHGNADKVEISLSNLKDEAIIKIADNGTGIDDALKSKVFEKNFVAGKSGNTGIGLYIVKKTIERYNGKIHVEDNKPQGTTFIIKIRNHSETN